MVICLSVLLFPEPTETINIICKIVGLVKVDHV
jgi:hypothetical protein